MPIVSIPCSHEPGSTDAGQGYYLLPAPEISSLGQKHPNEQEARNPRGDDRTSHARSRVSPFVRRTSHGAPWPERLRIRGEPEARILPPKDRRFLGAHMLRISVRVLIGVSFLLGTRSRIEA